MILAKYSLTKFVVSLFLHWVIFVLIKLFHISSQASTVSPTPPKPFCLLYRTCHLILLFARGIFNTAMSHTAQQYRRNIVAVLALYVIIGPLCHRGTLYWTDAWWPWYCRSWHWSLAISRCDPLWKLDATITRWKYVNISIWMDKQLQDI